MKPEYHEGPKARDTFDKGMTKIFQVPKDAVKEKAKPKRKRKKAGKD